VTSADLHWHCGRSAQQWLCSDPQAGQAKDDELYSNRESVSSALAAGDTLSTVLDPGLDRSADQRPNVRQPEDSSQRADDQRLDSYPDHFFAVQLLAAKHSENIAHYRRQYPHIATTVYRVNLQGEPWQLLIMGIFSSYQEAQLQLAALSPAPSETPWIRPLGPLKSLLAEEVP